MKYKLPASLSCSQCVLQWKYIAGNNWGMCANGTGAVGCGPQEEFRSCSDISIQDTYGTADETPYGGASNETKEKETTEKEKEETTPSVHENEIPEEETPDKLHKEVAQAAKTGEYVVFMVSLVVLTLLIVLALFTVLYFYYYHAKEMIQNWWSKGGSGLKEMGCWNAIKKNIRSCSAATHEKNKLGQKAAYKDADTRGPVPPPRTKKNSIGFKGVPENLV